MVASGCRLCDPFTSRGVLLNADSSPSCLGLATRWALPLCIECCMFRPCRRCCMLYSPTLGRCRDVSAFCVPELCLTTCNGSVQDGKQKVHKEDTAAKSEDRKRVQKKHSSSRTPAPAQHKVPAAGLQQTPAPPGNLATSVKTPKKTPLAEASPSGRQKGGSSKKEPKQSAAAPSAGTSEKKKKKQERRDLHAQAETAAAADGGEQPGGAAKAKSKKDKGAGPQADGSSKKAKKHAAVPAEGSTKKQEKKRAHAEVQQPEGSVKKRKKQQQQANI
jgi:hypothetical protein